MKEVSIWEKLEMQIHNLKTLHDEYEKGIDITGAIGTQIDYLRHLISSLETYYHQQNKAKQEQVTKVESKPEHNSKINKIEVWTDGGCRGNQSGNNVGAWAFTAKVDGQPYEKSSPEKNTTNNIQEMKAVREALHFVKDMGATPFTDITIYSDSAYVVNGMNDWRHNWKQKGWKKKGGEILNLALWKELDALSNEVKNAKFVKVKGHSDNEGNQRADELVNLAMDLLEKDGR